MVNEVRFGLLGPLLIEQDGRVVPVPAPKQRSLLVGLLARANQVVGADELVAIVWGRNPPPTAITTLRSHVKRLRECLGAIGTERITTGSAGYLIRIDHANELDVAAFTDGIHRGRAGMLDHDWVTAASELGAALGLWRGVPLVDVEADYFRVGLVRELERLRAQAAGWYAETLSELAVHRR